MGLKWGHTADTLVVSRGIGPNKRNLSKFFTNDVTQRVVLSLISAVYDPIGLIAPFTVKARLLLKDIWRLSGQKWVDVLAQDMRDSFLEWRSELPMLSEIVIPRCFFQQPVDEIELHVFGDSSKDVFLRGRTASETEIAFVFGKARVAPMETLTIPELELPAALLAASLRDEIHRALTLDIDRTFMWTDNTTVLQWLHSLEKQPAFPS